MKKRVVIILPMLMMLMALVLNAQVTQKLSATKASEYGIIYSLPTTVIDITIEVEKIVKKTGEFYQYAKKYLNTDDVITNNSESVELKSITVTPRGKANPSERYLMQFKPGNTPYLTLNEDYLPLAINTDKMPVMPDVELPMAMSAQPTPLESDAAKHVISGEIAQSKSVAKRAELAAMQLFALRQTRQDILTGEADNMPSDGKAIELLLNNIKEQEEALLAMFVGTTQVSTSVSTMSYVPELEVTNDVIARISMSDGIVDADNLAGIPIYITTEVVEKGALPLNEKGEAKTFPNGGVAYCIPGKLAIKINYDGDCYFDNVISSSQHGVVFGLDPKMFSDKKNPAYLIFDPITGAIQELGSVNTLP